MMLTATICAIALVCAILAFALSSLPRACGDAVATLWRENKGVVAALLVLAAWAVVFGGGKSTFQWDTGLTNNGSYTTNDTVHVAWTFRGIPAESTIYIDYKIQDDLTADWANLGEAVASDLQWDGTLIGATNYDFWVYSDYIPPVPVHTNGVWVGQAYETKSRQGAKAFLIINARMDEHGEPIAPPNQKEASSED